MMMQAKNPPGGPAPETIACEVCLKEIPRSVAHCPEGAEYVYYFCGADCYQQWQAEQGEKKDPGESK
jgi:hypothetical protein